LSAEGAESKNFTHDINDAVFRVFFFLFLLPSRSFGCVGRTNIYILSFFSPSKKKYLYINLKQKQRAKQEQRKLLRKYECERDTAFESITFRTMEFEKLFTFHDFCWQTVKPARPGYPANL
jgi:hypothetical protein